ncbi:MAG: hypothetical protein HUU10_08030 [Bacteroidetes bacterium]|nr:hypothetical protein [Bacteroidota bacterium]
MIKRITLWFIASVILPVLLYIGYLANTLSSNEVILKDLYDEQLAAVLLNLNQYAWSAVDNWANDVARIPPGEERALRFFLNNHPAVHSILYMDTSWVNVRTVTARSTFYEPNAVILDSLKRRPESIRQLYSFLKTGYRKLLPIRLSKPDVRDPLIAIVFLFDSPGSGKKLAALTIDGYQLIRNILRPRLNEISGEQYDLGIQYRDGGTLIFSTSDSDPGGFRVSKPLWIIPEYQVGIRFKNRAIDDWLGNRLILNISIITVLGVLVLVGIFIVFRYIRQEMDLVRLKTDFVSNVSHELRTPLALIRMYAETLSMNRTTDENRKKEYYRIILTETERLSRLINNILNFSRTESVKPTYRKTLVDVGEIVRRVLEPYQLQIEQDGFQADVILNPVPRVLADADALGEAVNNLIDNAIKYSRDRKYLRIETIRKGGLVGIRVEDRGIGIDQKYHRQVFDKFFRISSGLVHESKGSGLGLAITTHIINHHDGIIELESAVGKGSVFTIWIPAAKES